MIKPLLAIASLSMLVAFAPSQAPSLDGARSDAILKKIAQLDDLIQIVPLALTKDQIPPLLAAIEKVHQKQKELFAMEAKDLVGLDAKVSQVVDDGINKNVYPPRETQRQVKALMTAIGIRRGMFYNESVDNVFQVCKTTLNEGQLKAMEKSLKPEVLDPSVKVAEMDSDAKVKFFIRKVLLDPPAYDVLVQMSQRKEDSGG